MKLYHGTNVSFDEIDLLRSKPNKDFGKGFYLSADFQQAWEMSEARVKLTGGAPIVQSYDFNESILTNQNMKVLQFDNYTKEWAKFIIANRNNRTDKPVHDYDIVIGPIADDRVGRQLWRYQNHDIDMPTLIANLKYMRGVAFQYFFGTERAIKHLIRL